MSTQGPVRDGNGPRFDLIETLRWDPGTGFVRLERHLARLYGSAKELGFSCDPETVGKELGTVGGSDARRVRLQLAEDGKVTVTTQLFEPLPAEKVWTLRIAETRLSASDPLLRHKTSRRDIYQKARSEFPVSDADEVILLNERGDICEGTITSLFVDAGDRHPLLTPMLSCGLLAGVLRAELLDEGRAREAVLAPSDLIRAKAVFVGNSLRGLIPARLADC